MKIIRLPNGTWEWRVRIRGLIGQANGFAPTQFLALCAAMNRIEDLTTRKEGYV